MAIWPGEKLGLWWGIVEDGSVGWRDLDLSREALTTVTAGDSFYLYTDPTTALLPGDAIGECNWFVDVASGSATVTVETGYDDGVQSPWAPSGITEFAAGRVMVPLPVEDRAYARLAEDGSQLLRITVASGSVDLSSVWLQVEPPGGLKVPTGYVLSDWITPPLQPVTAKMSRRFILCAPPDHTFIESPVYTFNGDYNVDGHLVGNIDLSPNWHDVMTTVLNTMYGTMTDLGWTEPGSHSGTMTASADWVNVQARSYNDRPSWNADGPGFDYSAQMDSLTFTATRSVWEDVTYVRSTEGLPGAEGRDYVRGPDGQVVEYAGDSTSVGWKPGHILPYGKNVERYTNRLRGTVLDAERGSPHGEIYRLTGTFGQNVEGAQLPINPNIDSVGGTSWDRSRTSGASYVAPAAGEDVVMSARHDLRRFMEPANAQWGTGFDHQDDWVDQATASVTWYWVQLSESGDRFSATAPELLVQPPAFRYYIPVYDARKPRFYVTYTEVDEHPVDVSHVVGIGKPADDLSIFRVPTPLGTLRELRHGEKVTDVSVAYPLKVKLEDGSWTVVAGMTPDD